MLVCVFACSAECFKFDRFDLCLNNFKHYYYIISAEWMDRSTSYMHHLTCLFAFLDVSHSETKMKHSTRHNLNQSQFGQQLFDYCPGNEQRLWVITSQNHGVIGSVAAEQGCEQVANRAAAAAQRLVLHGGAASVAQTGMRNAVCLVEGWLKINQSGVCLDAMHTEYHSRLEQHSATLHNSLEM